MRVQSAVLALAFALGGCGTVTSTPADAAVDAAVVIPPDAPPASPSVVELTSAGGRLRSAGYSLDVQLGHAVEQRPIAGSHYRAEPSTAIKP